MKFILPQDTCVGDNKSETLVMTPEELHKKTLHEDFACRKTSSSMHGLEEPPVQAMADSVWKG